MLLKLSQFFPLSLTPPSTSHSLRQSLQYCSCPWVMSITSLATPFPTLYFTSPWIFCNYLFVLLNPLTSSSIPTPPTLLFFITEALNCVLVTDESCSLPAPLLHSFLANLLSLYKFRDYFFQL